MSSCCNNSNKTCICKTADGKTYTCESNSNCVCKTTEDGQCVCEPTEGYECKPNADGKTCTIEPSAN
ncbi:hypothetical protein MCUN1_003577 [Malassezia cuniculi]|uniref:Uncharacterized protein n=1 Tax=Malassezia cuniculi TaxID=948313 RepID=A0AAF0J837_9BASI|nr:hypothetical protein MCUN1_003577 [Malassezia cuniculi]